MKRKAVAWPEAHRLPSWNLPSNPEPEVLDFTPQSSLSWLPVAGGRKGLAVPERSLKGALTLVAQDLTVRKLSSPSLNPSQSGFRFSPLSFSPILVKTGALGEVLIQPHAPRGARRGAPGVRVTEFPAVNQLTQTNINRHSQRRETKSQATNLQKNSPSDR